MQLLKRLWPEEDGENLSEYGLLLLLISLLAVAGMRGLATSVDHAYGKASIQVVTSSGGGGIESISTGPIADVSTNQVNRDTPAERATPADSGQTVGGLKTQMENSHR